MGRVCSLAQALLLSAASTLIVVGAQAGPDEERDMEPSPPRTIEAVLEEHRDRLLSIPGVVGVGIGMCQDTVCIRVFVSTINEDIVAQIPTSLDGYEVEVEETDEFRARGPEP